MNGANSIEQKPEILNRRMERRLGQGPNASTRTALGSISRAPPGRTGNPARCDLAAVPFRDGLRTLAGADDASLRCSPPPECPSMQARPFVVVLLVAFFAACSDGGSRPSPATFARPDGPAPDVYRGVFPCEDCPGIDTSLWLRADGAFFWRQEYLDDQGDAATTVHNRGRWQVEPSGTLVLNGAGPPRRLEAAGPGTLLLLTPSALEHRLSVAPDAPAFTDSILIEGIAIVENGTATLAECRTALTAPASGADMRRFVRQYRSLGYRGEPVLVELEARFDWADDGTLRSFVVDRFSTIKARSTCSPHR